MKLCREQFQFSKEMRVKILRSFVFAQVLQDNLYLKIKSLMVK